MSGGTDDVDSEFEHVDPADFTAEHVGLVVPRVDDDAARHLRRLVAGWGMLADLSFSDLLLYVPEPTSTAEGGAGPAGSGNEQFVVVNQVRPNTGQTLFLEEVVGRRVTASQRPTVARAAASGQVETEEVDSAWLGERIRVTAIPVRVDGRTVAVLARESALSMTRQPGELEREYLAVFERFARMVAAGTFPYGEEEVHASGAPRVGDGVLVLDEMARVAFASPNAVSALRRLRISGRIQGSTLTELGAETSATYRSYFSAVPAAEEIEHGETIVSLWCLPLLDGDQVDGAVVLLRDVSELRRRDRQLISKDATIREIHHRVKNNLQTISSLLRLQGRRLTEPSAKAAVEESVRRIRAIALVHEMLSRSDGDDVDFAEVVRPLVRMVEEGLASPDRPLSVQISGESGKVPSPTATSLAVVLNELLQNGMDHAYPPGTLPGGEAPVVVIELEREPADLSVAVVDDGVGLSGDFDPAKSTSLGLSIVRGLVEELGGEISFGLDHPSGVRPGTRVELTVPIHLDVDPDAQRPPGQGGRRIGP